MNHKVNRYRFFPFYATTCAEKSNHQLVVATIGAFTLTSVMYIFSKIQLFEVQPCADPESYVRGGPILIFLVDEGRED